MALAFMNVGEIKKITALKGREDVIRHLQNLGFAPGTEIQVVGHNTAGYDSSGEGSSYRTGPRTGCEDYGCLI